MTAAVAAAQKIAFETSITADDLVTAIKAVIDADTTTFAGTGVEAPDAADMTVSPSSASFSNVNDALSSSMYIGALIGIIVAAVVVIS